METTRLERRTQKKEQREALIKAQREQFKKRQRNKKVINYSILAIVILAGAYGLYVSVANNDDSGEHDALAQCLTEKGVIMYGTDWCPHCQAQKRLFGSSFKYVTYINCDLNKVACDTAGVQGYPTWAFPRGSPVSGEQTLESLAQRAECT